MRFVLLSDLHFGRADPDLIPHLHTAIGAADPDLVVIAGDFVQRARTGQYRAARGFLDDLNRPWLAVPGNHDIPLVNLPLRIVAPRACYRRWIAAEREPRFETGDVVIQGIDTTERWHHQRGRIDRRQIDRIAALIARKSAARMVFLVAHHPFHHGPEVEKNLMLGAPDALDAWARAGPHVILSGHLHTWLVEPFVARRGDRQTLQIHCGTGLSTRLRGEPNEFAVIEAGSDRLTVRRLVAAETGQFAETSRHTFEKSPRGWAGAPTVDKD